MKSAGPASSVVLKWLELWTDARYWSGVPLMIVISGRHGDNCSHVVYGLPFFFFERVAAYDSKAVDQPRQTFTVVAVITKREQQRSEIRDWSRGEEIANGLSHGVGFLATLFGSPYLLIAAIHHGGSRPLIGVCVFAASTMLLYM